MEKVEKKKVNEEWRNGELVSFVYWFIRGVQNNIFEILLLMVADAWIRVSGFEPVLLLSFDRFLNFNGFFTFHYYSQF